MKGQVEFFVILGLLFVVAVVMFYGYTSGWFGSSVPTGVASQQALIKTSLENFMRSGAYEVISTVSENGGYLSENDYPLGSVTLHDAEAPYWQYNGQTSYPNVPESIKEGLLEYINNRKDDFFETMGYSNVLADNATSVSLSMTNNRMIFNVYMPVSLVMDETTYGFDQPFTFTVDSNLGQIYDFAKEFTYAQYNNRFFEIFTLNAMLVSPLESEPPGSVHEVPMFVSLTECGQILLRTWFDIQENALGLLEEVTANTYMPGKSPRDNIGTSAAPEFEIPTLSNKYYSELDVDFWLPDGFELTPANFQFTPDPIYAFAKPVAFTGVCVSDPVYVSYFLNYPVVVTATDTLTGSVFRFAHSVYIQNNDAGEWAATGGYDITAQQEMCSADSCSASISVQDSGGNPLAGASVSFFGCPIGKTGTDGVLDASMPCGVGTLKVYKNGYQNHEQRYASSELYGATITLTRMPLKNVYLYEVNVRNESVSKQYRVNINDVGPINTVYNHDGEMVMLRFYSASDEYYDMLFTTTSGQISFVPGGEYSISGTMADAEDFTPYGGILADYTLDEEDGDLYIYLPYTLGFSNIASGDIAGFSRQQAEAAATLTSLLQECGLGSVSSEPVHESFEGCIKGYDEL